MTDNRPPTPRDRAKGLVDLARHAGELNDTTRDALLTFLLPNTPVDNQADLLVQLTDFLNMEAAESAAGLSVAAEWLTEALEVAGRAIAADDLAASEVAR